MYVYQCSLLLSYPSDISEELDIIKKAIRDYNEKDNRGVNFKWNHYKPNVLFDDRKSKEENTTAQIVENADAVVCIFADKLEVSDKVNIADTLSSINKHRPVSVFFSSDPLKNRPVGQDLLEYNRLNDLKSETLSNAKISSTEYTKTDFKKKFEERLESLAKEILEKVKKEEKVPDLQAASTSSVLKKIKSGLDFWGLW